MGASDRHIEDNISVFDRKLRPTENRRRARSEKCFLYAKLYQEGVLASAITCRHLNREKEKSWFAFT